MTIPETGLVLGIDIGFSATRRSSGVAVLEWSQDEVRFQVDHVMLSAVEATIARFVTGREIACAALDGPFRGELDCIGRYRNAEKVLTRVFGQRIGKPGSAGAPVGMALNQATNSIALGLCERFRLAAARHRAKIHDRALVEAFPTHFLGVMLQPDEIPPARRRNRSDRFYSQLLGPDEYPQIGSPSLPTNSLRKLLEQLLPGRVPTRQLVEIRNHDQRAALVCAMTALCVQAGEVDGFIFLPPPASSNRLGTHAWAYKRAVETARAVFPDPDRPAASVIVESSG